MGKLVFGLSTTLLSAVFWWEDPKIQLVAPIFPEAEPLNSTLRIISSEPTQEGPAYKEFTVDGDSVRTAIHTPINEGEVDIYDGGLSLSIGELTQNGWVLVTHPHRDRLHAVVTIEHEDRPVDRFVTQVFRPGLAFWLIAEKRDQGQTGIAIVNPTRSEQQVSVEFLQYQFLDGGIKKVHRRQSTLRLAPWSKKSQFLSELVDLEGLEEDRRGVIQGPLRIHGETRIVVGALYYSKRTDWFQSVIVSPYPDTVNTASSSSSPDRP